MKFCSGCKRCFDDGVSACAEGCTPSLSEARPGDTDLIAGYRLEYLLDSGVRGETYRARRIDCGRSCLIKIVQADEAAGEEFLREAKIAQAIFHHGIADTYEAGRLNDREAFVVAEDPQGQSVRALLDGAGPPDLLTTIRVARQTAEAVHALHSLGVVHRALNPSNIFLSTDHKGELLVRIANIDLGGAAERSIVSNKFLIDTALDSLRYFSPEQCRGETSTAKADVYALGVILYELLAGSPPFDAANASGLIEKHLTVQPPDIKIQNFDLRALLSHTLMEALQKRPSLRQASADLFARQMRHIEQLATHISTPPPIVTVRPQPKAPPPTTVIAVPTAELDLPSIAETESERAGFVPAIESFPAAALDTPADDAQVVRIKDSYAETLGPRVGQGGEAEPKASRLSRAKSRHKNLRSKAASLAGEILDKASFARAETAFADPIDFGAVRRRIPALLAKAQELKTAPKRKPRLIQWHQPLDDVPTAEDAIAALSLEGITPSFDPPVKIEKKITSPPPVIELAEPERVDIAAPKPKADREKVFRVPEVRTRPKRSVEFSPTLFGAIEYNEPVRAADEPAIFAAIDGLAEPKFPRARRVLAAGAALGVLAVAFAFRGDIADALTPYDLAAEYPVIPVRSAPAPSSALPVPVSARPDEIADEPHRETKPPASADARNEEADDIKPITVAAPRTAKKETDDERPIPPPSRPQPTKVPVKSDPPFVPSKRVITYSRDGAERDPITAPKTAAGMTRPRIVKNPKP